MEKIYDYNQPEDVEYQLNRFEPLIQKWCDVIGVEGGGDVEDYLFHILLPLESYTCGHRERVGGNRYILRHTGRILGELEIVRERLEELYDDLEREIEQFIENTPVE